MEAPRDKNSSLLGMKWKRFSSSSGKCHNRKNMETMQIYTHRWTNKQTAECRQLGVFSSHKNGWRMDGYYDVDQPWKHYGAWQRWTQKATCCVISLHEVPRTGRRGDRLSGDGHQALQSGGAGGGECILKWIVETVAQFCEYTKIIKLYRLKGWMVHGIWMISQ